MIVFDLLCANAHRFEGWFASNEDFDRQRSNRMLNCPQCGHEQIDKLPTAKIKRTGEPAIAAAEESQPAFAALVEALLSNSEDVGRQFAQEARRIHYEETPRRNIRGLATSEENTALREEGIEVFSLPLPRAKMN